MSRDVFNPRILSCEIYSRAVGSCSNTAAEFHIVLPEIPKMCSFMWLLVQICSCQLVSPKLHARGATQLSRYTVKVTQASKNMEVGLVTSSCKMSLSLGMSHYLHVGGIRKVMHLF